MVSKCYGTAEEYLLIAHELLVHLQGNGGESDALKTKLGGVRNSTPSEQSIKLT